VFPKGIPAGSEGALGPIASTEGLGGPLAPGEGDLHPGTQAQAAGAAGSIFYTPQQLQSALESILGPATPAVRQAPQRLWLYALLLIVTLVTTTVIGAGFATSFYQNRPFDFELDQKGYQTIFEHPGLWQSTVNWALDFAYTYARPFYHPELLILGLPYSLTLMSILLAHELGHFFACLHHRVDATPPAFLPAPTLIGTFGAFIRIRSPIYSKRALFDIGIAGPIAGFVLLVPALYLGIVLSRVIPGIAVRGDLVFGIPLLQRLLEMIVFPGVPVTDIYLHPVARAAWVGILATALNLLPIGQLDGGHILYSFLGEKTKILSRVFVLALVPLGLFAYYGWLFWAALLFFFGMRHPSILDQTPLSRGRKILGFASLLIFILCFTPVPIKLAGL